MNTADPRDINSPIAENPGDCGVAGGRGVSLSPESGRISPEVVGMAAGLSDVGRGVGSWFSASGVAGVGVIIPVLVGRGVTGVGTSPGFPGDTWQEIVSVIINDEEDTG